MLPIRTNPGRCRVRNLSLTRIYQCPVYPSVVLNASEAGRVSQQNKSSHYQGADILGNIAS